MQAHALGEIVLVSRLVLLSLTPILTCPTCFVFAFVLFRSVLVAVVGGLPSRFARASRKFLSFRFPGFRAVFC